MIDRLMDLLGVDSRHEAIWVVIGLAGQTLFMMRFIVQWLSSERAKKSVVPIAFWYFSIGGAVILFAYAVYRQDPVFILGQSLGLFVYLRNLVLIRREAVAARSEA